MPSSCLRLRVCPDGRGLVRDVDTHRAPGDAAAAADAARGAELVDPARELVRHPLPIARTRRLADAAAVDKGEIHGEAGIPFAHPLGGRAAQIAVILDRRAEAGRAHHGAVAAGETALGDVVPSRMIEIALAAVPLNPPSPAAAHLIALFARSQRPLSQFHRPLPRAAELA